MYIPQIFAAINGTYFVLSFLSTFRRLSCCFWNEQGSRLQSGRRAFSFFPKRPFDCLLYIASHGIEIHLPSPRARIVVHFGTSKELMWEKQRTCVRCVPIARRLQKIFFSILLLHHEKRNLKMKMSQNRAQNDITPRKTVIWGKPTS